VSLLLSPGEAGLNEGTAARQEIEQVSQSAAHYTNHEGPGTPSTELTSVLPSALGWRPAEAAA
jgi:hypothetical protein